MRKAAKQRSPEAEALQRTASALRLVYSAILPRMAHSDINIASRLGYSSPSYNRACVQNHEFFVHLGIELGEWWLDLVKAARKDDPQVRRIIREYQEEAATELAQFVARLPGPKRGVVELKSSGLSWKAVMKHPRMNSRVYFSVMEDWNAALQLIWVERGDLVRRLI